MIKTLRIRPGDLLRYEIIKRSLDARRKKLEYVYVIDVEVKKEQAVLKRCPAQISRAARVRYEFPHPGKEIPGEFKIAKEISYDRPEY